MNKRILSFVLFIFSIGLSGIANSQSSQKQQFSFGYQQIDFVPTFKLPTPDMAKVKAEDERNDKAGLLYRIGVGTETNITPQNAGVWKTKANGDHVWQLKVKQSGAEALSFLFSRFILHGSSTMDVFSTSGVKLHKTYTSADVIDHGMQNMSLCFADEVILQLVEPAGTANSELVMDMIMYGYRSTGNPMVQKINESDACQVNVNCSPEGNNYQDEKRGIARILVVDGANQGYCSGTVVNNLNQDCKPYFLTALHCGVTSTTANFNQWRFYFGYQAPTCTNPSTAGTLDDYFITGCVKLASSNDGGGNTGSDFLLVQMGTLANEANTINTLKSANFNAYWNGWDANNTASTGGVSIHHPAGDIKKISTYTSTVTTTAWNGNGLQSHWRVIWAATTNGHGVTEGGSSGSPLFTYNGGSSRVVGTLTGGASFCTATSAPDSYGKVSYHWTSNGSPTNQRLKTYLDPNNTGTLVLDGSANPCAVSAAPVANFVGNPLTLSSGGTVAFTDLTSGSPTSWAWTISPGTAGVAWSYTGGTSATSQNPQVIFNTVGMYTITLVATNGLGSDSEIKTNYINVTAGGSATYCVASGTSSCASSSGEYISGVQLGSLTNLSACSNYSDFTTMGTNLSQSSTNTVIVQPQTTSGAAGSAFTNDEIAVWIDFNADGTFATSERVGYFLVGTTAGTPSFNFTVPANAVLGNTRMRVRISYQPDDGAINPCGTSTWGEVEDYRVTITAPGTSGIAELQLDAINVYPNPVNDVLMIDLSSLDTETTISLYDFSGKLIVSRTNLKNELVNFDLSQIAKGMYHVVIESNSVTSMRKITKM